MKNYEISVKKPYYQQKYFQNLESFDKAYFRIQFFK